MSQLDLVWELEEHDDLISKYRKKYEEILLSKNKEKFLKDLNKLDLDLNKKKNLKDKINIDIRDTEKKLKTLNYDLEKIEKELYDGQISDIKQLEYLNKKKFELINFIDCLEDELIIYLDNADDNIYYIDKLDKKIKGERSELNNYLKGLEIEVEKLRNKIKIEEAYILKLRQDIDRDLLDSYDKIKKIKNKAIVKVEDGVCKGCNMILSSALWDRVKNDYSINHCENCGRILIYKE